jgi:nicotinate phosphoribosyltransferase
LPKRFPEDYGWGVLTGIEEGAYLLKDLNVNVRAMKEGTIFRAFEPVMEIEGMYSEFGLFETSLLGLLCQASGVATKAARCKKAAEDRRVVSFGARRIHPVIAEDPHLRAQSLVVGQADAAFSSRDRLVAIEGEAVYVAEAPTLLWLNVAPCASAASSMTYRSLPPPT